MPDYDTAYPVAFDPQTGDERMVVIGSGIEKGQCAAHIADMPLGGEHARPSFGRPELAFGTGVQGQQAAAQLLYSAVDSQEPRVAGQYKVVIEPTDGRVGRMTADVRGVADDITDEVAQ